MRITSRKSVKEIANYSNVDSSSEHLISYDSGDDPTYEDEIENPQSKFSKSNLRDHIGFEEDDGGVSDLEEISVPVLNKTDLKNFNHVQKLIHAGQIEKLKLDQCKVYLRKHGLRLTGKKEILIQRIKEHLEILNGGEKKFPPSSFVINCKGDACTGDIVMFEQTVYEGYNLVSRSAIGPPCGKRIVAGRIVKDSYGAAKQQHTFTVEVLWSKGEKTLPPLYPLLIKGRNLYKLNTRRQRWEDEAERQRVLDEKHCRGLAAHSNRVARIQEKEARMMIKGKKTSRAVDQSLHNQKNTKHESEHITQKRQTSQAANPMFQEEFKGNSKHVMPRFPPNVDVYKPRDSYCLPTFQRGKLAESSYGPDCGYSENPFTRNRHNSYSSLIGPPIFQHGKTAYSNYGSDCGYLNNSFTANAHRSYIFEVGPPTFQHGEPPEPMLASHHGYLKSSSIGNAIPSDKFQQAMDCGNQFSRGNKENTFPRPYFYECSNMPNYAQGKPLQEISYGRKHQMHSNTQRKVCPYYTQGRCYHGNQCKFLHELNRNNY